MEWEPNDVGTATKSIVFTNKKAWLIVKPMRKELDLKFYHSEKIQSPYIKKHTLWGSKWAHHIRLKNADQIDEELLKLLKSGYDFAMST